MLILVKGFFSQVQNNNTKGLTIKTLFLLPILLIISRNNPSTYFRLVSHLHDVEYQYQNIRNWEEEFLVSLALCSVILGSSQYQSQTGTSHLSLVASQKLHLHTELELLLCLGKFCEQRRSLSFLGSLLYHLLHYQKWFSFLQKGHQCMQFITIFVI